MKVLKNGWSKVKWNNWQVKNRSQEIEKVVEKVTPPWVNNQKTTQIGSTTMNNDV